MTDFRLNITFGFHKNTPSPKGSPSDSMKGVFDRFNLTFYYFKN